MTPKQKSIQQAQLLIAPCSLTGQQTKAQENSRLSTTSRSLLEKKENGLLEHVQVVIPLLHYYSAAVSAGEN
jgi:hypothetical protein